MKTICKKFLHISINILVYAVVLLSLLIMAGSIFKNEKQLAPWGTGFFVVTTGSMQPAIPVRSMVFVCAVPAEKIQTGDILTFFDKGDYILTHRVVGVNIGETGYSYVTRGDTNNMDDDPVSYEKVIGRVVLILPQLGRVTGLFQNLFFTGSLIAVIGCAVLFWKIYKYRKRKVNTKTADPESIFESAEEEKEKI